MLVCFEAYLDFSQVSKFCMFGCKLVFSITINESSSCKRGFQDLKQKPKTAKTVHQEPSLREMRLGRLTLEAEELMYRLLPTEEGFMSGRCRNLRKVIENCSLFELDIILSNGYGMVWVKKKASTKRPVTGRSCSFAFLFQQGVFGFLFLDPLPN